MSKKIPAAVLEYRSLDAAARREYDPSGRPGANSDAPHDAATLAACLVALPSDQGGSMHENLLKAKDSAQFAVEELRAAMTASSPVEALILLPMIGEAAKLLYQIDALISAMAARG